MTATAAAQTTANETEEGDVTIDVSSTIAVDVQPANLDYSNAEVGNRNTSSDRGFGAIEIENTGSEYVNRIWLNTSTPSTDPFGSGLPGDYDAGNFLEVRPQDTPNGDSTDWHYVNRKEFLAEGGTSAEPSFIQVDDFVADGENYEVGSIRRGNESIYFAIDKDNDATCNLDEPVRVGNVSSTDNRLGTVDFGDSTEFGWTEYTLGDLANSDYGAVGVELNWTYTNSGNDNQYDLITRCDPASGESHVFFNRYNINTATAEDLATSTETSYTQFLLNTDDATNMLAPGELATVETAINIPEGVAAGSADPGALRVLITADEGAEVTP
jgi:hypothetical protein